MHAGDVMGLWELVEAIVVLATGITATVVTGFMSYRMWKTKFALPNGGNGGVGMAAVNALTIQFRAELLAAQTTLRQEMFVEIDRRCRQVDDRVDNLQRRLDYLGGHR